MVCLVHSRAAPGSHLGNSTGQHDVCLVRKLVYPRFLALSVHGALVWLLGDGRRPIPDLSVLRRHRGQLLSPGTVVEGKK